MRRGADAASDFKSGTFSRAGKDHQFFGQVSQDAVDDTRLKTWR